MNVLEEMLGMMEIHTVNGVHWKRGKSLSLYDTCPFLRISAYLACTCIADQSPLNILFEAFKFEL